MEPTKATILNGYDKNSCGLVLKEIPFPGIGAQVVLGKVHTAGGNPLDNMILRGEVKMIVPYYFPLVVGNAFVGPEEKTGASFSRFSAGDRVYGRMPFRKIGTIAEYAAVNQSALAKVPEYLSGEEAACVPLTALTALQTGTVCLRWVQIGSSTIGQRIGNSLSDVSYWIYSKCSH